MAPNEWGTRSASRALPRRCGSSWNDTNALVAFGTRTTLARSCNARPSPPKRAADNACTRRRRAHASARQAELTAQVEYDSGFVFVVDEVFVDVFLVDVFLVDLFLFVLFRLLAVLIV